MRKRGRKPKEEDLNFNFVSLKEQERLFWASFNGDPLDELFVLDRVTPWFLHPCNSLCDSHQRLLYFIAKAGEPCTTKWIEKEGRYKTSLSSQLLWLCSKGYSSKIKKNAGTNLYYIDSPLFYKWADMRWFGNKINGI